MNNNKDTSYSKAIEKVMLKNGYFAPLDLLYKEVWKYKDKSKITGKHPNYTMMETVHRNKKKFTRIGFAVYALTTYLDKIPKQIGGKK